MTAELRNWIIRNDYATTPPLEVRDRLSGQVEISRNTDRWYLTGIGKLIGRDSLLPLLGALEATPQLKPMLYLLTSGIFLDDPETRQSIADVRDAGVLSADAAALLLDTGILYGPVWQKAGLKELPTIEEIELVQATIASEQLREQVAQRYQAVREAMDAGEILDWEAARAALGAEWVIEPVEEELTR